MKLTCLLYKTLLSVFILFSVLPVYSVERRNERNGGLETADCPNRRRHCPRPHPVPKAMPEEQFEFVLDRINRLKFNDDRISVIELIPFIGYINCSQCARIISTVSFDSEKFKVLNLLVPLVTDPYNCEKVCDVFSAFDKDKVRQMLLDELKNREETEFR